jgi:spoIIIJ-associated protein
MDQWVEAEGSTVEVAVSAALGELGLSSVDEANVEVLQEPKGGFLGMGAKFAIVKVSRKPKERRRRRSRGKGSKAKDGSSREAQSTKSTKTNASSSGGKGERRPKQKKTAKSQADQQDRRSPKQPKDDKRVDEKPESAPIEEQAKVAEEFLVGLLGSFGLDGTVTTRVEDDVLYMDVQGEQTEALIGAKGAVMQSVLELTRTTVQRKTFGAPRMRIDIAGYGARRREALQIYTGNLAAKVVADGGEAMLEPMNAADRKAVHDAVADIDGVRSYSEGEDPNRAVVITAVGDDVAT